MCLACVTRTLGELHQIETAIVATGGPPVATVAIQGVHHRHCGDPQCRQEGHVHVRVRRRDRSKGEWMTANGSRQVLAEACAAAAVPLEMFDEQYEADERGLSAAALAAVERYSAAAAAASAPSTRGDDEGEEAECSICMEPLDATKSVGGFAKLAAAVTPLLRRGGAVHPGGPAAGALLTLPCGHRFHDACLRRWAARHTTCPYCRAEVTEANVNEMTPALLTTRGSSAVVGARKVNVLHAD